MRTPPNLLKSRHGVYYLRLYHDSRELKRSLGTKDFALAKLRLYQFQLAHMPLKKFEVDLAQGIFKTNGTPEDAQALATFLDRPEVAYRLKEASQARAVVGMAPVAQAPNLGPFLEVVEGYLAAKKLVNSNKTLLEKQKVYENFSNLFPNLDTNHITKDMAVAFKNRLLKTGAGNSILNKKISYLKDFLDYGIDHGFYKSVNPFIGLSVEKKGKNSFSYAEFTDEELKIIFTASAYQPFMGRRPNYFWLPLLALFTGARLNELAGMRLADIYRSSNVWVIYNPAERSKNENSIREIPIHKKLIEFGFLDYVEKVRISRPENGLIFPELATMERIQKAKKEGIEIDFGKNCGREFGNYLDLKSVNITDKKKVFHSFRSTFINRLTNVNGTHPAHIMGIVGHMESSKIDLSSPHFKNYQHKKPINLLKQAIDRLDYPFLNLTFFKAGS